MTDKELDNDVLRVLYDRAPNHVREEIVLHDLPQYDPSQVRKALSNLVEGRLILPGAVGGVGGEPTMYRLDSYENVPVRHYIRVGDTNVPRAFSHGVAVAEDLNFSIEAVAEYAASLEDQFKSMYQEQLRSYWASVISLFAIFIALFSFVVVSTGKLTVGSDWSGWDILFNNLLQLLPAGVLLALFVIVVKKLFG